MKKVKNILEVVCITTKDGDEFNIEAFVGVDSIFSSVESWLDDQSKNGFVYFEILDTSYLLSVDSISLITYQQYN